MQNLYCEGQIQGVSGLPTAQTGVFRGWKQVANGNTIIGGGACDCGGDAGTKCEGWHQELTIDGHDVDFYVPCITRGGKHVCCQQVAYLVYYPDPAHKAAETFSAECRWWAIG